MISTDFTRWWRLGGRQHEHDSTSEKAHFVFANVLAASSVAGKPDPKKSEEKGTILWCQDQAC